uniref:Uncharacterized protein n=1 Tax=Calidris pygmaea TaxID=425635 RepID=A0A8C3J0F2_9CHAR
RGTSPRWAGGVCVLSPPPSLQVLTAPSPPCSWDRKNNPEPWNKLSPTDQYKVSTGGVLSPHPETRPGCGDG